MQYLKTNSFIFSYTEDLIISVVLEDFYDSDNGEEYGSENYDEYNEWSVHIKEILKDKNGIIFGKEFLVLNYKNFPQKISTSDGQIIYKNDQF
jgi:hypothetical protein